MQLLVPTEWVEQGWGLELLSLVVHNKFRWVAVPQIWAFTPCTAMLDMPWLELVAVA